VASGEAPEPDRQPIVRHPYSVAVAHRGGQDEARASAAGPARRRHWYSLATPRRPSECLIDQDFATYGAVCLALGRSVAVWGHRRGTYRAVKTHRQGPDHRRPVRDPAREPSQLAPSGARAHRSHSRESSILGPTSSGAARRYGPPPPPTENGYGTPALRRVGPRVPVEREDPRGHDGAPKRHPGPAPEDPLAVPPELTRGQEGGQPDEPSTGGRAAAASRRVARPNDREHALRGATAPGSEGPSGEVPVKPKKVRQRPVAEIVPVDGDAPPERVRHERRLVRQDHRPPDPEHAERQRDGGTAAGV
jgi:hypothetical protein